MLSADNARHSIRFLLSQVASERLARRFGIGADAIMKRNATSAERFVRVLGIVGGRIAEGLVVASLVVRFVFRGFVRDRVLNSHVTLLSFFYFLGFGAVFEPADALSAGVMPHPVRIKRTILAGAESDFHRLIAHTVQALGSDSFEW